MGSKNGANKNQQTQTDAVTPSTTAVNKSIIQQSSFGGLLRKQASSVKKSANLDNEDNDDNEESPQTTVNKSANNPKIGFGSVVGFASNAVRRMTAVEVKSQQDKSEKLARMVKATLSQLTKGSKNILKMDPSMLPDRLFY